MPKDPDILELNDSRKELRAQLREVLNLSAAKAIDREQWAEITERVRNALLITEEIEIMLTEE